MARGKQRARSFVVAAAIAVGAAQTATACAFHGYTPDPTVVDVILASDHVVLARPDPASPGRYAPVAALIGSIGSVEIPIPVDAETRARLQRNAADTVLMARDGAYGPWMKLAVLDDRYRALITTVVARQGPLSAGGGKGRFQLFADHVNDPNPDIRRLALMELDRADYGVLRRLDIPKVSGLHERLETGETDLRPIRILLAGLSGDKALGQTLADGLDAAARRDVAYLGAYATALIELGGASAVAYILDRHLVPGALPVGPREKIVEALALQKQNGPGQTRREIRSGVRKLLAQSPELAGAVARQFGYRSDWSMAAAVKRAAAAQAPATIEDIFAVSHYLGRAGQSN